MAGIFSNIPEAGYLRDIVDRAIFIPHPHRAYGVYLLIKDSEVVYVGQSRKALGRLIDHAARIDYDIAVWMQVAPDDLDAAELAFIVHYNPRYNKQLPKNDEYISEASAIGSLVREGDNIIQAALFLNACEVKIILGRRYYSRTEITKKINAL